MSHEYQTAFDVLGVAEQASVEDVRNRFAEICSDYGMDENAVPARVRDAFAQLGMPGDAAAYREILSSAREGRPLVLAPADVEKLLGTCTLWKINCWRDRYREDHVYHVWDPTQPEPAVVTAQRAAERAALPGRDPFAARRRRRRIARLTAVAAVLILAGWGWNRWAAHAEQMRQAALHHRLSGGVEHAVSQIAAVQAARRQLMDEFQTLTGAALPAVTRDTPRPRELDLALIRHQSVREAWDALLQERSPDRDPERFLPPLSAAKGRLTRAPLSAEDIAPVEQLNRELDLRLQQLNRLQANLSHIREMLAADRLEHSLNKNGRSSP